MAELGFEPRYSGSTDCSQSLSLLYSFVPPSLLQSIVLAFEVGINAFSVPCLWTAWQNAWLSSPWLKPRSTFKTQLSPHPLWSFTPELWLRPLMPRGFLPGPACLFPTFPFLDVFLSPRRSGAPWQQGPDHVPCSCLPWELQVPPGSLGDSSDQASWCRHSLAWQSPPKPAKTFRDWVLAHVNFHTIQHEQLLAALSWKISCLLVFRRNVTSFEKSPYQLIP